MIWFNMKERTVQDGNAATPPTARDLMAVASESLGWRHENTPAAWEGQNSAKAAPCSSGDACCQSAIAPMSLTKRPGRSDASWLSMLPMRFRSASTMAFCPSVVASSRRAATDACMRALLGGLGRLRCIDGLLCHLLSAARSSSSCCSSARILSEMVSNKSRSASWKRLRSSLSTRARSARVLAASVSPACCFADRAVSTENRRTANAAKAATPGMIMLDHHWKRPGSSPTTSTSLSIEQVIEPPSGQMSTRCTGQLYRRNP